MKLPPLSASNLSALLLAAAALAVAPACLAQEEAPPNINVIVDDSALDDLPYGSEEPPLPAPDRRPISRLLVSPSGQVIGTSDLASSPEATFSAVPTTPIQSTELSDPATDTETASTETPAVPETSEPPAAEETSAGDPPAEVDTANLLEGQIRIPYEEGSDVIPETVKGEIVGLIERMNSDYSLHLQVLAYAAGDEDEFGLARGISLSRALAMRNFLTENGLDLSRMDVRALGNTAQEDPADRVDLIPLAR